MDKAKTEVEVSEEEFTESSNVDKTEDQQSVQKDDENDENNNLSSAELVGQSDDIMSMIIKMIPGNKERSNLKATCKRFYYLCNDKKNFKPFLKLLDRTPATDFRLEFLESYSPSDTLVKFYEDILYIAVPHYNSNASEYLDRCQDMIKLYNINIKKLEIESLHDEYLEYFGNLNCFEYVESVTLDVDNSVNLLTKLFGCLKKLKPTTMKFSALYPSRRFNYEPRITYSKLNVIFPKHIKTIELDCLSRRFEWLFYLSNRAPRGRFDTLKIGDSFLLGMSLDRNFERKFIKLMECFKNVIISLQDRISSHISGYFLKYLSLSDGIKETNVEYDMKVTLIIMGINHNRLFPDEWMPDDFEPSLFDPLFLKMKCLRVAYHSNFGNKPLNTVRNPFAKLVKRMIHLTTLEMSMKVFGSLDEFNNLVDALNSTVKNVKFIDCKNLDNNTMELLSNRCFNLENLSIEDGSPNNISIQKIISFFKNLRNLSISFLQDNKSVDLFKKLVGADNEDGKKINIWPNLDLLQLVFDSLTVEEREEIEEIERNTPRRCGVLLVNKRPATRWHPTEALEIIFKKSPKYYEQFIKLFTKPSWLK